MKDGIDHDGKMWGDLCESRTRWKAACLFDEVEENPLRLKMKRVLISRLRRQMDAYAPTLKNAASNRLVSVR